MSNDENKITQKLGDSVKKVLSQIRQSINELKSDSISTAKETVDEVNNTVSQSVSTLNEDINSAVRYRTEYDALMNKKRLGNLTTSENKYAQILKSNIDYYEDLRDEEFNNIKIQYDLGEITAAEYYSKLAVLRDTYFEEGSSEWAKYTIKILNYGRDIIEQQEKQLNDIFKSITSEYNKSFNEIMSKQESMYNKLTGISDIYDRVSFTSPKTGNTYKWLQLSDIDSEVKALTRYNDALISVKDRTDEIFEGFGLDKSNLNKVKSEFFEQLAQLNVGEAIGFSNYLMNQSDEKLVHYLEKWVEKINLSEVISKTLYYDEADAVVEAYTQDLTTALSEEMIKGLAEIPDVFYQSGTESCNEFRDGFLSAFDNVMNEITVEIDKKLTLMMPDVSYPVTNNSITNNSSYNIYESSSPQDTVLEIYKQDTKKRMLTE